MNTPVWRKISFVKVRIHPFNSKMKPQSTEKGERSILRILVENYLFGLVSAELFRYLMDVLLLSRAMRYYVNLNDQVCNKHYLHIERKKTQFCWTVAEPQKDSIVFAIAQTNVEATFLIN